MSAQDTPGAQIEDAQTLNVHQPAQPPAQPPGPPSTVEAVADEYPEPEESADPSFEPIDFEALKSALKWLDPDCVEKTWAVRVAALANAGKSHPHLNDRLLALAKDWSSGRLRGRPAKTWTQTGAHGGPRMKRLHYVWQKFRNSGYAKTPVTIRSIFFHAREQGWEEGQ